MDIRLLVMNMTREDATLLMLLFMGRGRNALRVRCGSGIACAIPARPR